MPVPFVGPSYSLANKKASISRAVNLVLVGMETPGKAPWIMNSVDGYVLRWSLGEEIRGAITVGSRSFIVAGGSLYELDASYTSRELGKLNSTAGPVDMAYGLTQLVIVDGQYGYVLNLSTSVLAQITSPAFYGSDRVAFLDNYFLFIRPNSQQFYITAINDATDLDALDFASAESSPDNLVSLAVDHGDVWLFGELTIEPFGDSGSTDFPFTKRGGASLEVGCAAAHSVRKVDSTLFWIGRDVNGVGIVYRAQVYQPVRISTRAVEEALRSSTDISQANCYAYQKDGLTYYCINAPGLDSTWCYELSSGTWHERCDINGFGNLVPDRGTCHFYGFGAHYVGGSDGSIYELDSTVNTKNGDLLVRERVSPHEAIPGRVYQFFSAFYLDAASGDAPQGSDPQLELSYSDDSGASWSDPQFRSIGKVGERNARVLWTRLGRSRDRVWKLRFTEDAPFSIIDAGADAQPGSN